MARLEITMTIDSVLLAKIGLAKSIDGFEHFACALDVFVCVWHVSHTCIVGPTGLVLVR